MAVVVLPLPFPVPFFPTEPRGSLPTPLVGTLPPLGAPRPGIMIPTMENIPSTISICTSQKIGLTCGSSAPSWSHPFRAIAKICNAINIAAWFLVEDCHASSSRSSPRGKHPINFASWPLLSADSFLVPMSAGLLLVGTL